MAHINTYENYTAPSTMGTAVRQTMIATTRRAVPIWHTINLDKRKIIRTFTQVNLFKTASIIITEYFQLRCINTKRHKNKQPPHIRLSRDPVIVNSGHRCCDWLRTYANMIMSLCDWCMDGRIKIELLVWSRMHKKCDTIRYDTILNRRLTWTQKLSVMRYI